MTSHDTPLSSVPATPLLPLALTLLACLPVALGACQSAGNRRAPAALDGTNAAVVDWSNAAHDSFVAAEKYANPLRAVRVMAMVHIAQHDALAAIRPSYAAHTFFGKSPDADPVAAAASAAFEVLVAELPSQRVALEARLTQSLAAAGGDSAARAEGISLGQRAAAAILQRRAADGSDTEVMVKMAAEDRAPGAYRPTAPYDFIFAPGWKRLHPFALQRPEQFRVAPPPSLSSDAYAAAFDEVKNMGRKDSTARSGDATAYAAFWYEFSDIGWNRIARVVASERKLGLQATARLFALINMALSDAYVAGWDSKLHHDFWRPASAIAAAGDDGNPATTPDPYWQSEQVTPPIQDYPSTHSALGDAGAEVLGQIFGDATAFTFESTTARDGARRTFPSFTAAANENADSRVQAGLHFRFACQAGQALGRQVGSWVVATALRPLGN